MSKFDELINDTFRGLVEKKGAMRDPITQLGAIAADYQAATDESPLKARLKDKVTGGVGGKSKDLVKKHKQNVLKAAEKQIKSDEKAIKTSEKKEK